MRTQAQNLTVILLGTGNPILRLDRFGPSTLVDAGAETLLFDCGRGVAQRLRQLQRPLRVTAVFLTHLHSDHIVGIPDLWLTGWLFPPSTEPFRLWGPTGSKEMMANLEKAYQADIRIRIETEKLPPRGVAVLAEDITEGVVYEKNGVKVTAFDVNHGLNRTTGDWHRDAPADRSRVVTPLQQSARSFCAENNDSGDSPCRASPGAS